MNAYEVLNNGNLPTPITEEYFYKLIIDFRDDYFKKINYDERLVLHKKPVTFLNELLQGKLGKQGLYDYLQEIQRRDEMKDFDPEINSSGYVNSKIADILENDKRLKTLFNGVKAYCKLRSKDFDIIAVHVAECRAMNKAVAKIEHTKAKYPLLPKIIPAITVSQSEIRSINPDLNKSRYFENHMREMNEIRRRFEVVDVLTKEEIEQLKSQGINVEEGQEVRSIPRPRNHTETYELFKGYIGETMLSIYKNAFYQQYGSWLAPNVETEAEHLATFIANANQKKYKDAVNAVNTNSDNDYYRFLRLKNDYYLYNNFGNSDLSMNSPLATVYGKYFLFYGFLITSLDKKTEDFIADIDISSSESGYVEMIPEITWTSDNSITVQGMKYYFPFYGYHTCTAIMYLKEALLKRTVSALTLQEFPNQIFDENLFKGHYDFAGLIYNIIETIVEDAKYTVHKGNKSKEKLFDNFLELCEKRAVQFSSVGYSYSSLTVEAIQLLINYSDAHKCYVSGLEKITKGIYERNALDDLRLSLELLLKVVLSNNKSLEKQTSSLGAYCQPRGISSEATNMLGVLLDYYSKYQNKYIKHNDKINHNEIDFIFNLTSTFIKLLIQ